LFHLKKEEKESVAESAEEADTESTKAPESDSTKLSKTSLPPPIITDM
jgi:hypothetical protein